MKYKDLVNVMNAIVVNLGNQETIGQKKLYKIYDKLKVHLDEYKEKLEEIKLEHASVDEKNFLVKDDKGEYRYTKEAMKLMTAEFNKLAATEFDYKKIEVFNVKGLEGYNFLEDWVIGIVYETHVEL
jgi:hypothetical protein